ncbi:MAG: zinc-binding alcohol dehydrogenase family protein [Asticcacaulis sp.]|uniref:zinc-binding alcohol dehydrogenase family protein n=1 Tax=Asticcacaulis sp. TaxID=1872648 RepID=UPI0039E4A78D
MKALAYESAHPITAFALAEVNASEPVLREGDLLVEIKAAGFNPVDTKIRTSRSGAEGRPVILGWDASGVVIGKGAAVSGFEIGDAVYYAGDLTRDGSYAERQTIDHRLVAKKPASLSFAEAAAVPLTALTAWEMLFEQFDLPKDKVFDLLVIGGAGGVGSLAIQFAKALTKGRVYSTSGRPESAGWLKALGADGILDRNAPLKDAGFGPFQYVFSTTHSHLYLDQLSDIMAPFGTFGLIDDPKGFDINPLKRKALKIAWEFMFTKSMFNHRPETQGQILTEVAALIDAGRVRTTLNRTFDGLTADNVRQAHEILESGKAVGKMVAVL